MKSSCFKRSGHPPSPITDLPWTVSSRPDPIVTLTSQNEIMLSIPPTGEMIFFSLNGEKLSTQKVTWENEKVSAEKMQKSYQSGIKRLQKYGESEKLIEKYGKEGTKQYTEELIKNLEKNKDQYTQSKDLPYFSTIIEDSDHNLLFFVYPEEKGENSFNVYTFNGQGNFVCKSSFECDNYNLEINPQKLVFKDGLLYGLQDLKNADGIPMRLVKFKLEPTN